MNHVIRIKDNFAKISFWMLPLYILVGALTLWVGHGEFKENVVLDKYAETTFGDITIKRRKPRRWGYDYYAFYEFTPDHYYTSIGTSGFLDSKIVTVGDSSRSAVLHYGKQRIPKGRWNTLKVGDEVMVEYALYKNTFMTRIYNPVIPWMAILFLFLAALSAISFIFIVWGKLSNKRDVRHRETCSYPLYIGHRILK